MVFWVTAQSAVTYTNTPYSEILTDLVHTLKYPCLLRGVITEFGHISLFGFMSVLTQCFDTCSGSFLHPNRLTHQPSNHNWLVLKLCRKLVSTLARLETILHITSMTWVWWTELLYIEDKSFIWKETGLYQKFKFGVGKVFKTILKEITNAHQCCICLIKLTVKALILWHYNWTIFSKHVSSFTL